MKKILAIGLALAMLLAVAGCGKTAPKDESSVAPESSSTEAAPESEAPESESASEEKPAFDMTQKLNDGKYKATVDGQEGPMEVEVEIAEGKIAKVTVLSNKETPDIAKDALEKIPAAIVEKNSVEVEAVSGATMTSERIIKAVIDCLNQAVAK